MILSPRNWWNKADKLKEGVANFSSLRLYLRPPRWWNAGVLVDIGTGFFPSLAQADHRKPTRTCVRCSLLSFAFTRFLSVNVSLCSLLVSCHNMLGHLFKVRGFLAHPTPSPGEQSPFGCHDWRQDAVGVSSVDGEDGTAVPHLDEELSHPKCQ